MRSNIITIVKKELARFFGDKRMVFTTVLMPGLMIYLMYCLMGNFMSKEFNPDEEYVAKGYVQNLPAEFEAAWDALSTEWTVLESGDDIEEIKQLIQNKEADVLVVFPEQFADKVAAYDTTSGESAPNVGIYYNSAETESANMKYIIYDIVETYEASIANKVDINAGDITYDCATEKDMTAQAFSMMMPLLLMTFLFSGCIAVAPESIAGEKERGTIATLLVTPMKRSALALGKVLALSFIALLSGLSSFIGTIRSLPKLMEGSSAGISTDVYSVSDYALLLGIILSTVFVLIAIIAVVSAFAKSVKEANTAVSPLMVVVLLVSIAPMLLGDGAKQIYLFMVPVFNSALCMSGIFSFAYEPMQVVTTIVANIVTTGILSFVLTKLFGSEEVMFAR